MCVSVPIKISSIKNKKPFVEIDGKEIQVSDFLVKVKKGDYVFLRDALILGKTTKEEAKQIINLIENKI